MTKKIFASGFLFFLILFVIIYAVTDFTVTINSPTNNTITGDSTPGFNFIINGTEYNYVCELYLDDICYGDSTDITSAGWIHISGDIEDIWSNETYIYVANYENGLKAYTFDGTSFSNIGNIDDGGAALGVHGNNTHTYLANGADGLRGYIFNGTTFTGVGHIDDSADWFYDVFVNDSYIFIANGNSGLKAYTFNGSVFTLVGSITDRTPVTDIWSDGSYIYTQQDSNGIIIAYSFNGTTFTNVGERFAGYIDDIWGDGTYIYTATYYSGLRAFTFDGTSFSNVGNIDDGSFARSVWGDGTYIYLANDNDGIRGYTFDGSTFVNVGHIDQGSGANAVWGDGDYVYLGFYLSNGMRAYNMYVINNTVFTITANDTLNDDIYDWYINCTSNSTVKSSYTYTLNIDLTSPVIISNITTPTVPLYSRNMNTTVNLTDAKSIIMWCNFTLTDPNSVVVVDNVNGTVNVDEWISSNYTIDSTGIWTTNYTCSDLVGNTISDVWTFNVSLGNITLSPSSKSFSQIAGNEKIFNLTFSQDGIVNNTIDFNLSGDIVDATNFTITFEEDPIILEESETQNISINITSNISLDSGTYTGNITWNRTEDDNDGDIEITIIISAFEGIINMTPENLAVLMTDVENKTTTLTINNTGNRILENCNLSIDTSLSSYATFNNSNFNLSVNNITQVLMTISNPLSGIYSATISAICTATSDGDTDTDTSGIIISVTKYAAPAYGGGDGEKPDLCGNGICNIGESYESCPSDCYIAPNMTMDIAPEVFTIATSDNRLLERTFQLRNPNPIDIELDVGIICIEDDSCNWIFFTDENGTIIEITSIVVPAGNELSPGLKNVNFYIDIPDDIEQIDYYLNIVGSQQTLSVVLPVKISVSESFDILYILSDLLGKPSVDTETGEVTTTSTVDIGYTGLSVIILIFISIGYVLWRREKGKK